MSNKRAMRNLSRLELTVLGLVSKGAPCTAYWIRRQFQLSPSSFYSGSAGAVYPAMRRLEARTLVTATTRRDGKRKGRDFRLTEKGRQVLKRWLMPPLPDEDIAFTHDPVRTRVYYLEALTASERQHFVDESLSQAYGELADSSKSIDDEIDAALAGKATQSDDRLAELKAKMGMS